MQAHISTKIRRGLVTAVVVAPLSLVSANNANLYQSKCAVCHGKKGGGKPSTKVPSLVSNEVRKMSDETIRSFIMSLANGEMERDSAHTSLKRRLTESQITQLVSEVRKLQENHK